MVSEKYSGLGLEQSGMESELGWDRDEFETGLGWDKNGTGKEIGQDWVLIWIGSGQQFEVLELDWDLGGIRAGSRWYWSRVG